MEHRGKAINVKLQSHRTKDMATRATTGTVAHTWRIRNFGSVREIFSSGKLYSDTFWCPPLLLDKQQPRSRIASVGDSHSHHRGHSDAPSSSSLVPMSWVIVIYPNGNNRRDHCSCYLRVVPTPEENQRTGWKRDHMNFTLQVQVVQKKTKFGAPETVDLVTWTSDSCSFDAENPDWGNHKLLEHTKLPPIETDHDLLITIHVTFHIVDLPKHSYSNYNLQPVLDVSSASSSPFPSVADPDSDSLDEDDSAAQFVFPPLDLTSQLADPRFADITFSFSGDPRLLHAHRVILTPRAPGLLAHLSPSGEWLTSSEPIVVPNVSYDVFSSILHYVYSSRFPPAETADARLNDVQFLISAYEAAQTYKMDELMTRCAKQVAELADDEFNLTKYWAPLFRFGFVIKEKAVRDKVLPWIIKHWDEVKGSEALKLLTAEENLTVWLKDTFQDMKGQSNTE